MLLAAISLYPSLTDQSGGQTSKPRFVGSGSHVGGDLPTSAPNSPGILRFSFKYNEPETHNDPFDLQRHGPRRRPSDASALATVAADAHEAFRLDHQGPCYSEVPLTGGCAVVICATNRSLLVVHTRHGCPPVIVLEGIGGLSPAEIEEAASLAA